ncbi:MAG: right-handed parallel beta-helix repeat-containing protein, partial [Pseudonocardiaceae bacterium]
MRLQLLILPAVAAVATATLAIGGAPSRPGSALATHSPGGGTGGSNSSTPHHGALARPGPTGTGSSSTPAPAPRLKLTATNVAHTPTPATPGAATGTPGATPTGTPGPTARPRPPAPRPTPNPTPPPLPAPGCHGPALTSQSQVAPNTAYCGGHAFQQIVLDANDSWTSGEVSGVSTAAQRGAVECQSGCLLVNMNIHDNPRAWAGIYAENGSDHFTGMTVRGGRVSGSGDLGIGGGGINGLLIDGVEIDHNGASANCGDEGGGFKGVNHGSRITNSYVHNNNCMGIWYDINAANNVIDHNTVANNSDGGIFYEISQYASIFDNVVSGNGAGACSWLWGAGIGIASSFNVQVYGNTLSGNCNGIAGTQQNRLDSTPPAHLLENLSVHDNRIAGSGQTGVVADNGAVLSTRNI